MTLRNSTVHTSSLSLNLSLNTSDLWAPPSPVAPTLVLHPPLPAIIVVLCLFLVFGSCVTFLAVCRWPGMCRPAPCPSWRPDSPVEPQLLLWKRLGSARGSFPAVAVGSFRRPMHPSALDFCPCVCVCMCACT
uniref:Uncharacterized protein n=1 Tax=Electrophorus electricus TaxID=8005 RepID=A0A4W4GT90_ELEEL